MMATEPQAAAPDRTTHVAVFTGRKIPDDGTEYLVTTYYDADGLVLDQTVATRTEGPAVMWGPPAYLDPAPGTDPTTGRVLDEAPC